MLSRETFEMVAKDYLSEMSSTDSYKKSKLGTTIFNDLSAKYTKAQEAHYRREVGEELGFINLKRGTKAYEELMTLTEGHTYKSHGKTHIKMDFFGAHMIEIMNLFFAAGGRIGDS